MHSDLLEECVEALKALRAEKHEELGAGVTAELDAVIRRLEVQLETADGEVTVEHELVGDALEVLARCLQFVTNLAEIIHWFFGPR